MDQNGLKSFSKTYNKCECVLSESANNRKLNGAADTPERTECWDAIHRDLVKLKE